MFVKPTKFCDCISCTDCQHYAECMGYTIEAECAKGKLSFGKLKVGRFPIIDVNLKD